MRLAVMPAMMSSRYHPEELYSMKFIRQKMDYIHFNPVKAGWVHEPYHWIYSSAADYFYGKQTGAVKMSLLDVS